LLQLACVRLELLFRCRLRFLRPAEMTHAGRPKLRIRRLESIARRADCCVRPLTRPALAGLQWAGFRVIPARAPAPFEHALARSMARETVAGPRKPFQGGEGALATGAEFNFASENFARYSPTTEAVPVVQHLVFASRVSCGLFSPTSRNRSITSCVPGCVSSADWLFLIRGRKKFVRSGISTFRIKSPSLHSI
jgi:hypothetical protein